MSRFSLLSLFLLLPAPAFAKPYPLPCREVWSAVTDTLGNMGNYRIIGTDNEQMRASFIVFGALYPGVHAVFLKPKGNGCELEVKMGFTGNDDEGALRNRVNRALKRKATKPTPPPLSSGGSK